MNGELFGRMMIRWTGLWDDSHYAEDSLLTTLASVAPILVRTAKSREDSFAQALRLLLLLGRAAETCRLSKPSPTLDACTMQPSLRSWSFLALHGQAPVADHVAHTTSTGQSRRVPRATGLREMESCGKCVYVQSDTQQVYSE